MASADVVVNGVRYAPITQAQYNKLLETLQESRECRYLGVEEARVWCKARKGTETLEEGLKACTVDELHELLHDCVPPTWASTVIQNFFYWVLYLLREREKRQAQELAGAAVETIMPEDEEDVDGADDD